MSYADFDISFSDDFKTAYTVIVPILGAVAVSLNIVCIISTRRQTKVLSVEYTKCLTILKVIVLLYDFHLCFFFIPFPLFPCQGLFMHGVGVYLGMKTHVTLVFNLCILTAMCAWYTCCLFQRYQSILPANHTFKAPFCMQSRYNHSFSCSPMSWLLSTPSFKIYNDDNSPLLTLLHFPLSVITFLLNIAITIFFTLHTDRVTRSRINQISAATVSMNIRVVKNLQFQSNISTIGMITPFVFWTISMVFGFIATEVSTLLLLLLPLGSIFNSVYVIATNKWTTIRAMLRFKSRIVRIQSTTFTIQISSSIDNRI